MDIQVKSSDEPKDAATVPTGAPAISVIEHSESPQTAVEAPPAPVRPLTEPTVPPPPATPDPIENGPEPEAGPPPRPAFVPSPDIADKPPTQTPPAIAHDTLPPK